MDEVNALHDLGLAPPSLIGVDRFVLCRVVLEDTP
jgi:hypothetical protein